MTAQGRDGGMIKPGGTIRTMDPRWSQGGEERLGRQGFHKGVSRQIWHRHRLSGTTLLLNVEQADISGMAVLANSEQAEEVGESKGTQILITQCWVTNWLGTNILHILKNNQEIKVQ